MSFTQKQRAKVIANTYKNFGVQNKRVLDVGCGNGVVSKVLSEKFNLELYGTDILDYRKTDILFKKMGSPDKLPFKDAFFDYILFNDVLHHSEHIEALLVEAKRVGKNILIFEDMQGIALNIFDQMINRLYSLKMPPPQNFKSRGEWCALFDKLDFEYEIGEIKYPFWYPFQHMSFNLIPKKL